MMLYPPDTLSFTKNNARREASIRNLSLRKSFLLKGAIVPGVAQSTENSPLRMMNDSTPGGLYETDRSNAYLLPDDHHGQLRSWHVKKAKY
jgi:hypothetical protein